MEESHCRGLFCSSRSKAPYLHSEVKYPGPNIFWFRLCKWFLSRDKSHKEGHWAKLLGSMEVIMFLVRPSWVRVGTPANVRAWIAVILLLYNSRVFSAGKVLKAPGDKVWMLQWCRSRLPRDSSPVHMSVEIWGRSLSNKINKESLLKGANPPEVMDLMPLPYIVSISNEFSPVHIPALISPSLL